MADYEDRYWNSPDGLRLHYRDYAGPADGPPIICLPGLTRNARDFEPVADRFAGEWRVIAIDFRGRGMSDYDPQPANYQPLTYARDVMKLLDQLGIATAVFFGTSLGGLTTFVIAATDEERIAGALINDVGPVVDQAGIDRIKAYVGRESRWADWDSAARAQAEQHGDLFPDYSHDDWLRHIRRVLREEKDGSVAYDYDMAIAQPFAATGAAPQPELWHLIEGLKGKPMLVVRGETSDLFSVATAERMVREFGTEAELVTVPRVGHAPMLDEPEAVAGIERLLAKVRAAG